MSKSSDDELDQKFRLNQELFEMSFNSSELVKSVEENQQIAWSWSSFSYLPEFYLIWCQKFSQFFDK